MYKLMVFTFPSRGHLNSLWPILIELLKTEDFEILVYLDEANRLKCETIGAEFRAVINNFQPVVNLLNNAVKEISNFELIKAFFQVAFDNCEYLSDEIEKEAPDLIIYDVLCVHFKQVVRYYEKFKRRPMPAVVCFSPGFAFSQEVYPNKYEHGLVKSSAFWLLIDNLRLLFVQFLFSFRYGLKITESMQKTPLYLPEFVKKVFVCVVPEVQPRAHLFDRNRFKFIGSTINENFVSRLIDDEIFNTIISISANSKAEFYDKRISSFLKEKYRSDKTALFDQLDSSLIPFNEYRLIYASMGTFFNSDVNTFIQIIDAFKRFDQEPAVSRHPYLRMNDIIFVVSVGGKICREISEMIDLKELKVAENIVIVDSAPQIDILKKSALFITHGGINSVSESIHFGVPMVMIPMNKEQTLVSYRISDELGLGIRLDRKPLKSTQIRHAMHKILTDKTFYLRSKRFAEISRTYNGPATFKNELYKILKNNNNYLKN